MNNHPNTLRLALSRLPALALVGLACLLPPLSLSAQIEAPTPFPACGPGEGDGPNSKLPVLLSRSEPAYPAALRDSGLEGRVYVAFVVDSKGSVQMARAAFGSRAEFEQAAVAAVEGWTFNPGSEQGRPVNTQMIVALYFKPAPKP